MINKNLELIRNLARFKKNYHIYVGEKIADLEITSTEFSYLKELINNDGSLQDVIVKNTCVDKAATTRIAQSLEKKGIIKRVKNEKDRRNFNVFLTEKGQNYIPIINNILESWYNTLISKVGEEKLNSLISILSELSM